MVSLQNINRGLAAAVLLVLALSQGAHAQGTLVSWGADPGGQPPAGLFTAVAAGGYHSVAIRTDGTLVSWGDDSSGQVSGTPAGTFSAVAVGFGHCVAIRTDGTLVSWGDDSQGQVSGTPSGTFRAVAAGGTTWVPTFHSVAIRTDGTLVCWGDDSQGQVTETPAGTFTAAACGSSQSLAIRSDGTLVGWGRDISGIRPVPPAGTFTAVAAGEEPCAALRTDGTLVSWWTGGVPAGGGEGAPAGTFTALAAGYSHFVAIRTDGTLVSWDHWSGGQLNGTPAGTYSAVAAGFGHSVAIATPSGNQAPVITLNGPVALWSPNHELVDVSSALSVSDPDGNPVALTFRVFSDETEVPDTGDGTGKHAPDFKNEVPGGRGLLVRSERRGAENGRFYILVIMADDGHGGVTTAVCPAAVCPRDQNQQSLSDVLAQADIAAAYVQSLVDSDTLPPPGQAPAGMSEHGLAPPQGPFQ